MSDFIGRMAARAVGERAAAWPRVPSLFETTNADGEPGIEVIDEEVVAPTPDRSARAAALPSREPVEARASSAVFATAVGQHGATQAGFGSLSELNVSHERPSPAPEADEPVRERVRSAQPDSRPRPETPASAVAVAEPPLQPTVPTVAATRAPVAAPPATAARPEPSAVRVHIGRLEVRANLHEPIKEPPRREPARPPELSLADYLRGKRDPA